MQNKTFGIFLFLATIILITVPVIWLATAAATGSFTAAATIGNSPPNITWVLTSGTGSPSEGTSTTITLAFNVTDNNTVSDINMTSAFMNITRDTEQNRTSSSCTAQFNSSDSRTSYINCSITIWYYDSSGNWTVCAYVRDNSSVVSTNCTAAQFVMGTTDSITIPNASIAFSGVAGQQNAGPQHVLINNSGNANYTTGVRINATYLNDGSDILGVGNFTVNVTDGSGAGEALTENSFLTIASTTMNKGAGNQQHMYFYVDFPAALPTGTYNSNRAWVIDPS